jgi:hypothetical protein
MKLECEPWSLAGPIDQRCIDAIQNEYGFRFDTDFLVLLPGIHGGVPHQNAFAPPIGSARQIGRFVPIVDEHSLLNPPAEPFASEPSIDRRIYQSLDHILGRDSSAFFLGNRVRFVPFVALITNDIHPDTLDHTNCECDYVCFDTDSKPNSIVLFRGDDAGAECNRHEAADDDLDV